MYSSKYFAVAAATFALITPSVALYDASSPANLALYWGSGPSQANLSYYCEQSTVDIIPLGFMNVFPAQGDGYPAENFGNACYGQPIFTPGPGYPLGEVDTSKDQLYVQCPGIQEGIPYCQSLGKKILLSLGGASATYQLTGVADGEYFADFLWGSYGPFKQSWLDAGGIRPMDGGYYGTDPNIHIDIDGFDFDIEIAPTDSSEGYIAMINRLREHFAENPSKKYFISGAPQCPLPEPNSAEFTYDQWVSTINNGASAGASIYLGLLGSPSAGIATDYISPLEARSLIESYHNKPQFGGVMIWEATYSQENTDAELDGQSYHGFVKSCLSSYAPTTTSTSSVASSTVVSSSSSTSEVPITSSTLSSIESSATSSSATPSSTSSESLTSSYKSSAAPSSTSSEALVTPSLTSASVSESSAAQSTSQEISTTSSSTSPSTPESSAVQSSTFSEPATSAAPSSSLVSLTPSSPGYSVPGYSHNATSHPTHSSKSAGSGTLPVHSSKPTGSYIFTGHTSKSTASRSSKIPSTTSSPKPSSGYTAPGYSSNFTVSSSSYSTGPYSTNSVVIGTGKSSKPYPSKSSVVGTGHSTKPYPTKSSVIGTGHSTKPYPTKSSVSGTGHSSIPYPSKPSGTGVKSCKSKTKKTKTKTSSTGPSSYPGSTSSIVISSTAPYGNVTYGHSRTKPAPSSTSSAEGVTVLPSSPTKTGSIATESTVVGSSTTGVSETSTGSATSSAYVTSSEHATSSGYTSSATGSASITGSISSGAESITSVAQYTTSTAYITTVYTITSCAASVTDCPARTGQVTTETISSYTTVCPVTASSAPTNIPTSEASSAASVLTSVRVTGSSSVAGSPSIPALASSSKPLSSVAGLASSVSASYVSSAAGVETSIPIPNESSASIPSSKAPSAASSAGVLSSIPVGGASSASGVSPTPTSEAIPPANIYTTTISTLINSQSTTISAIIAPSTITVVPVPVAPTSLVPPYGTSNGTLLATGSASATRVAKPSSYVIKAESEITKSAVPSPTALTFEGGADRAMGKMGICAAVVCVVLGFLIV
ncbi:hypothetical protein EYC84_006182 [Monilinia fructicola]|uniref:GH18 domain-containing protein n=1 Tax=Monilinia fructicola TaxID=38448 RepID=A0A5M9K6B8_MONFR|nr:hypothetical protein EYC84_006182 [Monilinia fructicola]